MAVRLEKTPVRRSEACPTDNRPWCDRAESLLRARGADYVEIDLCPDPAGAQELIERCGPCTRPRDFIVDAPIGGLDALPMSGLPEKPDEDHITATSGGTRP